MWMRCSFSNQIIDEVPQHLFPFYAAVEEDGEDSAYFISRLRSYMIDKLELPPHNLPLLAHAVAMFDAVQLSKFFTAWQIHYYQCRKMDEIALKNTRKRSIRWWKYKTNVRIAIRLRSNILQRLSKYRHMKSALRSWFQLLRAIIYRRETLQPRTVRCSLRHLLRHRVLSNYQRLTIQNGTKFYLRKRVIWAYKEWISQLNTMTALQIHSTTADFLIWLRALVQRNWIESQELRDMYICALDSRSRHFRCHRFIAYLASSQCPPQSHSAYSPEEGNPREESPRRPVSSAQFTFTTPPSSRQRRNQHVSFDPTPQFARSGRHDSAALSAGDLRLTPTTTSSSVPHSALRHLHTPFTPTTTTTSPYSLLSVHPTSPALVSTSGTDGGVSAVVTLGPLRLSLHSRPGRALLCTAAAHYQRLRCLILALRRWLYRIPQLKLDSPHSTAALLLLPPIQQQQRSVQYKQGSLIHLLVRFQGSVHLNITTTESYMLFKKIAYLFTKWRYHKNRRLYIKTRYLHLKQQHTEVQKTQSFGAWLITTARYQQLHRTSNRIYNNHIKTILYTSYMSWYYYYERIFV